MFRSGPSASASATGSRRGPTDRLPPQSVVRRVVPRGVAERLLERGAARREERGGDEMTGRDQLVVRTRNSIAAS